MVPSAGAADSPGKPALDGAHHESERRQPYRPSYVLREQPAKDQEPKSLIGVPFPQRLEPRLSEEGSGETGGLLPGASGTSLPKRVSLERTQVSLRLVSGKVTSRQKPGHQVVFEVEEDVRAGGSTCIARGTPVHGVVGPWTRASWGRGGAGTLEIHFEDAPMVTGMRVPVRRIRMIGRAGTTYGEVASSLIGGDPGAGLLFIPIALAAKAFGRAVFRNDEVKFRKGDVIRVNTWTPRHLPCSVGPTSVSAERVEEQ